LLIWLSVDEADEPEFELSLLQPVVTMAPATKPAMAAETINVLAVRVICIPVCLFF
jgi:hypothetical protein